MKAFIPEKGMQMSITKCFKSNIENSGWTKYFKKGDTLTITEVYIARGSRRANIDNYYLVGNLLISRKTHEILFDMSDDNGLQFEFRLDDLKRIFTIRDVNKIIVPKVYTGIFGKEGVIW